MLGSTTRYPAEARRITSTWGDGAHAPSGPPWTSTTVGSRSSAAPARVAIQTSIGPPAPGAWTSRISIGAKRSCQADPIRVRRRGWSPGSSTVDSSMARGPSVAR